MGGALPLIETVEEVETVLSFFLIIRDEPRTIHGSNKLCEWNANQSVYTKCDEVRIELCIYFMTHVRDWHTKFEAHTLSSRETQKYISCDEMRIKMCTWNPNQHGGALPQTIYMSHKLCMSVTNCVYEMQIELCIWNLNQLGRTATEWDSGENALFLGARRRAPSRRAPSGLDPKTGPTDPRVKKKRR